MLDRLLGRTRRKSLEEMILIFEKNVKPEVEKYLVGLPGDQQAIADGTLRFIESAMLSQMVQQTLDPPKPRPNVRRQVKLNKLDVELPA